MDIICVLGYACKYALAKALRFQPTVFNCIRVHRVSENRIQSINISFHFRPQSWRWIFDKTDQPTDRTDSLSHTCTFVTIERRKPTNCTSLAIS